MTEPLFSYIQGIAGVGKSYHLRNLNEAHPNSTVLTSTTGISAINMGAGITINSLLWYFNTKSLLDSYTTGKLDYRVGALYKLGIRRILTDEISMMCADDLSLICMAIDRLNESKYKRSEQLLGWTIAGDNCQLPPVSGDYAFESEYWSRFEENTTILRTVHRQADKDFVEALGWVRRGDGKKAAEYFEDNMHQLVDPRFDGTTLYPYNSNVDRQNQYRLSKVSGKCITFASERTGKERPEWKYIPEKLELKENALVMILANSYLNRSITYCNGDLGNIVDAGPHTACVKLKRNDETVTVNYVEREHEGLIRGREEVVGTIRYMPLRLAWATTVDKSQSLTLDCVQADLRSKFYKERPGMLYVALSRCRTKGGLRLICSPKTFVQNCKVNPKVERFL